MGLELSGTVKIIPNMLLKNTLPDDMILTDTFNRSIVKTLSNGAGSNQAQVQYHTKRTLTTGTNETLDLRALTTALGSAFGTTTFSKIKLILVEVETSNAGYTLEVGGAAANQFVGPLKAADDVEVIGAAGAWMNLSSVDGWTVDATHKDLKFSNPSGGTVVYRIWIVGNGTVA